MANSSSATPKDLFLGLDLGTSGLRALVVDEAGQPVAEASSAYDVSSPNPGWNEQDPALWIAALKDALRQLSDDHYDLLRGISGIGISGHMHGAVTLDARGESIRPCILWNDTRAHTEAARLDADKQFRGQTGNIVFPGFTAPKLAWMAEHEPVHFARIVKVILPKDYLTHWLTGQVVSDMSDASGTSWLDVGKRAWSPELIAASGMQESQMPKLLEGTDVVGFVLPERAEELGLLSGCKVVAGGADNACAACGIGAFDEGQGFVSLGTSGVVLVAKQEYSPDPKTAVHTFCHAVPDKWYQMGVSLAATDCLNWLATTLGSTAEMLAAELEDAPDKPSSLLFLPYLSGERTPHNDAAIRGAFVGLSKTTSRSDMTRAVMEGVAFAMRDCLEALHATGTRPTSLMAVGGGSKSPVWVSILADVLNLPIELPAKGDFGAAMGAARLAMVGVGGYGADRVMVRPDTETVVSPRSETSQAYETRYQKFRALYRAIKDI